MRILRIFFVFLVGVAFFGFLLGLAAREIFLYMGVNQVRSAARELGGFAVDTDFTQRCLEYGGVPPESRSLIQAQLRFISDKEYVLEIVCRGTESTEANESLRKVFRRETLPPLVFKAAGQAGIIDGQDGHGVILEIFGRSGAVYHQETFIRSSLRYTDDLGLQLDAGPITTCEGYGFECCNAAYQVGQGVQNTKAYDCPLSCHAGCTERPVVLTFNSNPSPSSVERVVSLSHGQPIEFFYTINDVAESTAVRAAFIEEETPQLTWDEKLLRILDRFAGVEQSADSLERIVISFGDGQFLETSDLQGSVEHTYTCDTSLCVYNAFIQAETKNGLVSELGGTSKIEIQVRP